MTTVTGATAATGAVGATAGAPAGGVATGTGAMTSPNCRYKKKVWKSCTTSQRQMLIFPAACYALAIVENGGKQGKQLPEW